MRNKFLLILIGIAVILLGYYFFPKNIKRIVSPIDVTKVVLVVTPTPTIVPTPILPHYDQSTNLKKALDSVNPQVENSDFESLQNLLPSL